MKTEGFCVCINKNVIGFNFGDKYRYTYDKTTGGYTIFNDMFMFNLSFAMFSGEFKKKFKKIEEIREEKIRDILED